MAHRLSIFEGVRKGMLHGASGMLGGMVGVRRVSITRAYDSSQTTRVVFNLICAALRG